MAAYEAARVAHTRYCSLAEKLDAIMKEHTSIAAHTAMQAMKNLQKS
jgi:hypothetical protein